MLSIKKVQSCSPVRMRYFLNDTSRLVMHFQDYGGPLEVSIHDDASTDSSRATLEVVHTWLIYFRISE